MSDPSAGLPPRYLRTAEAARFLSLSGRTLEKHRTYGTGPAYRKIGGRVVYAIDDLKAWADRGTRRQPAIPVPALCCRRNVMRPFLMQGKSGAEPCRTTDSLHKDGAARNAISSICFVPSQAIWLRAMRKI